MKAAPREGVRFYFFGEEWSWLDLNDLLTTLRKVGISRGNFQVMVAELIKASGGSDARDRLRVEPHIAKKDRRSPEYMKSGPAGNQK